MDGSKSFTLSKSDVNITHNAMLVEKVTKQTDLDQHCV